MPINKIGSIGFQHSLAKLFINEVKTRKKIISPFHESSVASATGSAPLLPVESNVSSNFRKVLEKTVVQEIYN